MNKSQLIDSISIKADISKKDVEKVINAFTNVVADTLKNRGKVQITGFGCFDVIHRDAREGRNPQTGQTMMLSESYSPKFKAGKALKDAVKA